MAGKPNHTVLEVTHIGNSLGVMLPPEVLSDLNIERGDKLFLTRSPEGSDVTKSDPDSAHQISLAREVKGNGTTCSGSSRNSRPPWPPSSSSTAR